MNKRKEPRTPEQRRKIAEGQKRRWWNIHEAERSFQEAQERAQELEALYANHLANETPEQTVRRKLKEIEEMAVRRMTKQERLDTLCALLDTMTTIRNTNNTDNTEGSHE